MLGVFTFTSATTMSNWQVGYSEMVYIIIYIYIYIYIYMNTTATVDIGTLKGHNMQHSGHIGHKFSS